MKFVLILVACLLAFAYADDTEVVDQFSEVHPEDFKYGLELSNHVHAVQEGHLVDKDNWFVKGEYEFDSKDGKHIKVTYTADDHGYHPKVEQ